MMGADYRQNNWYLIYLPKDICVFENIFVSEVFANIHKKTFMEIMLEKRFGGVHTIQTNGTKYIKLYIYIYIYIYIFSSTK